MKTARGKLKWPSYACLVAGNLYKVVVEFFGQSRFTLFEPRNDIPRQINRLGF